ncbi:hypothetical protein [Mucilaginibacter endophyticus]|uniref:hypothetical protein n=1 Tax=Mucilaginibacter endophyticus TaxID=2675003 RepID=UPI000E0D4B9F|nr:hypothetical protein [Mucilaginibacter endophyticus]
MAEPTRRNLENAKKFSWQWAVYVLLGVISFLYGQVLLKEKNNEDVWKERVANLRVINSKKDSIILDWQSKYINLSTELLYKNNIIDRQNRVIQNTDSLVRKKFEKPAKQIVKANE